MYTKVFAGMMRLVWLNTCVYMNPYSSTFAHISPYVNLRFTWLNTCNTSRQASVSKYLI